MHEVPHIKNNYVQLAFIEDIPNTPGASVPVYDCAGEHTHAQLISDAIDAWNNTDRVRFEYQGVTLCVGGFPADEGKITILHDPNITGWNHIGVRNTSDPKRADDVGVEGDTGVYKVLMNRIRLQPIAQYEAEVAVLVHELGHAIGLADLYNHLTGPPCVVAHTHDPDDTIMDCPVDTLGPLAHDIDNVDFLYKNPPTMVDDFRVTGIDISGGTASVSFAWTDKSFNEKVQYIGFPGAPLPLAPGRDEETDVWTGLNLDTEYCFVIVPENAYGVQALASAEVCVWIPRDLSGVYDILAHDGTENIDYFSCISRLEHNVNTNEINSRQQCNLDVSEFEDVPPSWCELAFVCNPNEPEGDLVPGPPHPPPYTTRGPNIGSGQMYLLGDAECLSQVGPCLVETMCFEDIASPTGLGLGPNIIIRTAFNDPGDLGAAGQVANDGKFHGVVDIWYNQNNADCTARTPKGDPNYDDLTVTAYLAYEDDLTTVGQNPARWRDTPCGTPPCNPNPGGDVFNLDGDSCYDWVELLPTPPSSCGDDPYNPSDSFTGSVDLTGAYDINIRVKRGDCGIDPQNPTGPNLPCSDPAGWAPGEYFICRSYLEHDTVTNVLTMPIYCYHDSAFADINPDAYPGETGDGFAGSPPPGPEFSPGVFVYGDVHTVHTVLDGSLDTGTQTMTLRGCFADEDGTNPLGDVWFVFNVSAHQLPGTASIWVQQAVDCAGSPTGPQLVGDPDVIIAIVQQPDGADRDADQDGMGIWYELQDNDECGRRDPFNKNDYYDVSVPRDGVIDLPNDILGVILEFTPGGYSGTGGVDHLGITNKINYDRPSVMRFGAGSWNRGSPDHVIDLPNDILGVILQFNPGGFLLSC